MSATVFQPVEPPIIVDRAYTRPVPTTLEIDNIGRLKGDAFIVKDQNGEVIISAKGAQFSSLAEKTIYDAAGQTLFKIKSDILTIHHTMTCTRGGMDIFKVKYHQAFLSSGKDKYEAVITDGSAKKHVIDIRGDWDNYKINFCLEPSDQVIAKVNGSNVQVGFERHEDRMGHLDSDEKVTTKYKVEVAPNVDIAVIAALCMCCDIIHKSTNN